MYKILYYLCKNKKIMPDPYLTKEEKKDLEDNVKSKSKKDKQKKDAMKNAAINALSGSAPPTKSKMRSKIGKRPKFRSYVNLY